MLIDVSLPTFYYDCLSPTPFSGTGPFLKNDTFFIFCFYFKSIFLFLFWVPSWNWGDFDTLIKILEQWENFQS